VVINVRRTLRGNAKGARTGRAKGAAGQSAI